MRLTEWKDETKKTAAIKDDAEISLFGLYNQLALYEDIGTLEECRRYKETAERLGEYMRRMKEHIDRSEDDGK